MKKGQGALEYILLLGGILLIVVVVDVILKGLIFAPAVSNVNGTVNILNNITNLSSVNLSAYIGGGGGGGGVGASCTSDSNCNGGLYCVNSACSSSKGGLGDTCTSNNDCLSNSCSSGTCTSGGGGGGGNGEWSGSISLQSPSNGDTITNPQPNFNFTVQGDSPTYNCVLYIDGWSDNSTTADNNTLTSIMPITSLSNGTHNYFVYCWGVGQSQTYYFVENTPFSINLQSPSNGDTITNPQPNFNFTVQGNDSSYACYLYIDGNSDLTYLNIGNDNTDSNGSILNNTLTTLTSQANLTNGVHNYFVYCMSNTYGYSGQSPTYNFTESVPSIINLQSPTNGENITDQQPEFNFTVQGDSPTYNCQLYIDGVADNSNSSVSNNTLTTLTSLSPLASGVHHYMIYCGTEHSPYYLFMLNEQAVISLQSPANNSHVSNLPPQLNFTVQGTSTTYNCTLYINGNRDNNTQVSNNTLTALTVDNYLYGNNDYYISCDNINSQSYNFIEDSSFVNVQYPLNNSGNYFLQYFNFTVGGPSPPYNCQLYLNNNPDNSTSGVQINTITTIKPLSNIYGAQNFYISCGGIQSSNYTFTAGGS
jgi:hypothetical protein